MKARLHETPNLTRIEIVNPAGAVVGSFVSSSRDFAAIREKLGGVIRDALLDTLRSTFRARVLHESREQGEINEGRKLNEPYGVTITIDDLLAESIVRELANNTAQSLAGLVELLDATSPV